MAELRPPVISKDATSDHGAPSTHVPPEGVDLTPAFTVHRPDFHRHFNGFPDFEEMSAAWLHGNIENNSGDYTRLYMLYQNIKSLIEAGVPGDFVEFGVHQGNSAYVLAKLARLSGRKTYLYDTFDGSDPPALSAVQKLVGTDNVVYAQGQFPVSALKGGCPDTIAVAHIDCDLYEPTRAGLEVFYPRLAPGGVLMLHDYGSGFWPGVTKAVDEFFADKPERPVIIPDKSGTAVVRRCFGA